MPRNFLDSQQINDIFDCFHPTHFKPPLRRIENCIYGFLSMSIRLSMALKTKKAARIRHSSNAEQLIKFFIFLFVASGFVGSG